VAKGLVAVIDEPGVADMLQEMGSAAALVREARAKAGLSCRALAKRAGVTASTISRIEEGLMDPTFTMLTRVLGAAGQVLRSTCDDLEATPSLARLGDAWKAGREGAKVDWTRLRGFLDWLSLHPEQTEAAIATPPARTGTPLDVLLAGMAEKLADDAGIPRPRWSAAVPALEQPWEPPGTPRMIAEAKRTTPEPLKRRNMVLAEQDLWRVHA
jgi:transcriptional regulator with XRE-family HTH domain